MAIKRKARRTRSDDGRTGSKIETRVSVLEASVDSLHEDIGDVNANMGALQAEMVRGFEALRDTLTARGRTDWGVIISGVFLALAFWSAGVWPMRQEMDRQAHVDTTMSALVSKLDHDVSDNRTRAAENAVRLEYLRRDIDDIRRYGSPEARERIATLEAKIAGISKQ